MYIFGVPVWGLKRTPTILGDAEVSVVRVAGKFACAGSNTHATLLCNKMPL